MPGVFHVLFLHRHRSGVLWVQGQTPLSAAAFAGHIDVVKMLLEQGADACTRNDFVSRCACNTAKGASRRLLCMHACSSFCCFVTMLSAC